MLRMKSTLSATSHYFVFVMRMSWDEIDVLCTFRFSPKMTGKCIRKSTLLSEINIQQLATFDQWSRNPLRELYFPAMLLGYMAERATRTGIILEVVSFFVSSAYFCTAFLCFSWDT